MTPDENELARAAAVAALPADHPERVAFLRTPRGRAALAAYREFMSPSPPADGARLAEAEARLGAVLRERAARGTADAPPARVAMPRVLPLPAARRSAPARPWLVAAALAVVLGALWFGTRRPEPGAPPLRGSTAGERPGPPARLRLLPATLTADSLVLAWAPAPGADRYEVTFYAADLAPLGPPRTVGGPRLALPRAAVPATSGGGAPLYRVTAYGGEDALAASPPTPLDAR